MSESPRVVSSHPCPSCQSPLPDAAAYCAQCGSATHTQIIGEASTPSGVNSASYERQPDRLRKALGPNYDLVGLIGRGGYAEVFQIHDRKLNRELAIKVLRPDLIVTPSLLARFRREAMSVAALRHPAIVPVYDVGESEGICYILMPLIEGESLKAVLQRQRRLPIAEVQRIVFEAAQALAVAHQANVVHRDIKPENIMLEGKDRQVRLMDFGIAKAVDSGEKDLTGTGVVVGTPQYMSPEQASGEPNIDHRSDQYALAVVAYQMLAGRAPFEGETARAIIAKQLLDQPPPLASLVDNVPAPIVAALHRALQKQPRNRFDTIGEFAAALLDPGYVNPPALNPPPSRRRRWIPWLAGSVAAGLLAGWALIAWWPTPGGISAPLPPAQPQPPQVKGSPPTTRSDGPGTAVPTATPRSGRDTSGRIAATVPPSAPARTDTTAGTPPAGCATLYEQRDWERAVVRCIEEARGGNPRAGRLAGELLGDGRGTVADSGKATEFFELAERGGDAEAAWWLGRRYENRDPSRSTEMYLKAAEAKVARAYPIIARRLDDGLGTARDPARAASWFEKAAAGGDPESQLRLAEMYTRGRGVARNDSAAFHWNQQAATASNPEGQYRVARALFDGKGTRKSDGDGMKWLRLAAEAGHAEARKELAKRRD